MTAVTVVTVAKGGNCDNQRRDKGSCRRRGGGWGWKGNKKNGRREGEDGAAEGDEERGQRGEECGRGWQGADWLISSFSVLTDIREEEEDEGPNQTMLDVHRTNWIIAF